MVLGAGVGGASVGSLYSQHPSLDCDANYMYLVYIEVLAYYTPSGLD